MPNIIKGHLTDQDKQCLRAISVDRKVIVDLGTYHGLSASILAENAGHVTTIDIFEDYNDIKDIGSRAHYDDLFREEPHFYMGVVRILQGISNITVKKDFTYRAANDFNKNSVDLLFIDADHSFLGVKRDVDSWESKIVPTGLIAFHDSNNENWSVSSYLRTEFNFKKNYEKILTGGSISVYKKVF